MVAREKEVRGNTDFAFLGEMRGLKTALMGRIGEEFGARGLKGFQGADPEVRERVVIEALINAKEEYTERQYGDKLRQVEQVLGAYREGRLSLPDLLQGLEITHRAETRLSPWGKVKSLLGR